jgi:UDP-N-acetylmuramate--L-alanine ligase
MRTPEEIKTAFADRSELDGRTSFVLVGIGGAGMSGVARMLVSRGFSVRGTDLVDSRVIGELRALGVEVRIGHTADVVSVGDAVVVSDAIPLATSPEVRRARELGCPVFRRSQALGWLLKDKKLIAVTGTHGKTTTTGMIGAGLLAAGLDPTIVVGAEVPQFGGSVVEGKGEWAVVEACEAYDSFHDFDPTIVVLTNLELDHVDFHGSWEGLKGSVERFVSKLPASGSLVYCELDSGALEIARAFKGERCGYGPERIRNIGDPARFDAFKIGAIERLAELEKVFPGSVALARAKERLEAIGFNTPRSRIAGDHNWTNAGAAHRTMLEVERIGNGDADGINHVAVHAAILAFSGAERRLQVLQSGEVEVVDDYAHHPTEIRASIQALREKYPGRRLVIAYQPHLYSRTKDLIKEFAEALDGVDHVFLTDIYPAREDPIPGVSSLRIAEMMQTPVTYTPSRHLLPRMVKAFTKQGDVVVGMGAGNIESFAPDFIQELQRKGNKIAVVYGGDSAEREVSLHSGREVHKALKELGYDAFLVDVTELLLNKSDTSAFKGTERPDLAFLCVHGTHAEDGAIQGFFELLHIPYIGSGMQASAIAMDKDLTKQVLTAHGLPTPKGVKWHKRDPRPELPKAPVIVKPNAQGSTVGLSFVEKVDQLEKAIKHAFTYDDAILVEEWVKGIEISVPVAGDEVLPAVEIVPASGRYDFEAKYTPGATEEVCPARISKEQEQQAGQLALKAHHALNCRGVTRTDMIVAKDRIVVLEVNTLPGMTATSLVPRSAGVHGWSFNDLVRWITEDALKAAAE